MQTPPGGEGTGQPTDDRGYARAQDLAIEGLLSPDELREKLAVP
jgi:hypothetical protein